MNEPVCDQLQLSHMTQFFGSAACSLLFKLQLQIMSLAQDGGTPVWGDFGFHLVQREEAKKHGLSLVTSSVWTLHRVYFHNAFVTDSLWFRIYTEPFRGCWCFCKAMRGTCSLEICVYNFILGNAFLFVGSFQERDVIAYSILCGFVMCTHSP